MRIALIVSIAISVGACEPPPNPAKSPERQAKSPATDNVDMLVEYAPGLGAPEIEFRNPTNRPLTVVISGPSESKVEVPPMQSRSAKVPAGAYRVRVLGGDYADPTPLSFEPDHRYRVVLRLFNELDEPRYAGKGLECVPIMGSMRYYLCGRTTRTCEHYVKGMPPDLKHGECGHYKRMFMHRSLLAAGVSSTFTDTASECETLRSAWLEENPEATATACEAIE